MSHYSKSQYSQSNSTRFRILVIEDSIETQLILDSILSELYEVTLVPSLAQAIAAAAQQSFDLFIIDWSLPDGNGLQFLTFVTSQKNPKPAIMLTAKDSLEEKLRAFEYGAVDFVTKPFHPDELRARIKVHLRFQKNLGRKEIFTVGGLTLDLNRHKVWADKNREISLTSTEFRLLSFLVQNFDVVLSRQQILDVVWTDSLHVSERTIDSHLSHLRKKLSGLGVELLAVNSEGYRISLRAVKAA